MMNTVSRAPEAGDNLIEIVKPSNIDISNYFFSTPFRRIEKETVARNIVIISKNNGDQWISFSFDEYSDLSEHEVTMEEQGCLNGMARDGFLSFDGEKYNIESSFIEAISEYIDTPERQAANQQRNDERADVEANEKARMMAFVTSINEETEYAALSERASANGFVISKLDRGVGYEKVGVSARFEVWFESPRSNSKIGLGDTLEQAVLGAIMHLVK